MTQDDDAVTVESESLLDTAHPFSFAPTVRAILRWKPDLVITRYWMSYFAPSLGYVTRQLRKSCKVISILDNVVPHEPRFFDTPLTKYFLKGSDGCVVMCSAVAEDLRKLAPDMKYAIIPHPLYTHFGEKQPREEAESWLGLRHGMKNLLFFGLIRDYKGLDLLLEAFAGLPDDYQLIVAGEPYGSFEKYGKILEKTGAKDRVRLFLEYIKDSQVSDYFSAADVVVLPYKSATQSGISAVAYHFDVPMIVTDVGGLRETIGEAHTGLVAEQCTPDCIRNEILKYFSNPDIKAECKANILKEKQRLSWENFCNCLLDFAQTI